MRKMKTDDYFIKKMSKFGIILWKLYIIRIFRDGSSTSFIINKYNPISYFLVLLNVLVTFFGEGYSGVKEEWHNIKFGLDFTDYWKKPENVIVWIKH